MAILVIPLLASALLCALLGVILAAPIVPSFWWLFWFAMGLGFFALFMNGRNR